MAQWLFECCYAIKKLITVVYPGSVLLAMINSIRFVICLCIAASRSVESTKVTDVRT